MWITRETARISHRPLQVDELFSIHVLALHQREAVDMVVTFLTAFLV